MNHASFIIKKAKLYESLIHINKSLGGASRYTQNTILELTITDDLLTLVVPGIKIELPCKNIGTAKATIGLLYFKNLIHSYNKLEIDCNIYENEMKIGVTKVNCQTTFFETDKILRSIKLPLNYTDLHILQLENNGYTIEELKFNELEFVVYQAQKNLKKNIRNTKEILSVYGFTAKEIEELIDKKIKM